MKVMINKIIRKKYGKFQSGSFGKKKHVNCFVIRVGKRKKKQFKTIKKALISSKGFELQIFEFLISMPHC